MPPVDYHLGKFPPAFLSWESLIPMIGPASAAIARYDGVLSAMQNATVLLGPLTTQEAVLSSRIEGTQATMGEVLRFEAEGDEDDIGPERRGDIGEILNYRIAVRQAASQLDALPLGERIIKQAHRSLMDGVRGHGKNPGEYRQIPNWIGPPNCSIEEAKFIPISADKLDNGMSQWERHIHTKPQDKLVHLAVLHAELEALHPFLDGNGRIGRMFVPLYMWNMGLLSEPMFYVSAFLEKNRDEYYERLLSVSRDNNWTDWCVFFLKAIQSQAEDNLDKATAILNLYEEMKHLVVDTTRSQYAIIALDWVFARPIFRTPDFVESSGIPKQSSLRILKSFKKCGILHVWSEHSGRRPATLAFNKLLNIAEGYEAF
jgi:Fic family protein